MTHCSREVPHVFPLSLSIVSSKKTTKNKKKEEKTRTKYSTVHFWLLHHYHLSLFYHCHLHLPQQKKRHSSTPSLSASPLQHHSITLILGCPLSLAAAGLQVSPANSPSFYPRSVPLSLDENYLLFWHYNWRKTIHQSKPTHSRPLTDWLIRQLTTYSDSAINWCIR